MNRFGAHLLEPGLTRFRLWAPTAKTVELLIEGRDARRLEPDADGWCETTVNCGAGTEYRYRIDGGLVVPDPASRAQKDDIASPSLVVDPSRYAWRHHDWKGRPWREVVLYELHVGLLGGFDGVRSHLKRLAEIGVTAIELMPVAEFPGARGWGYDGVLPYAPDSSYGAPEDLKRLVDEAHGLGLMVFLDVVYNHFGPTGNYLHSYAEHFFRNDTATPWGAAIDFRRAPVRDFFVENALYWLDEYRFDGLRFDAVHAIVGDELLAEVAARVRESLRDRHVHLVLENDDNRADWLRAGYDAQWNDDFHHAMHVVLTGETEGYYGDYAAKPVEKLVRALTQGFVYQGESSPHRDGKARGQSSKGLPPTSFVAFVQNHDQVGNRPFGDRLPPGPQMDVAHALLLLSPSIPLLFMGEETNAREPFLYFTDHDEELANLVREGRRREFKFVHGEIPDPNAEATFERSRPSFDGDGSVVRTLLSIRHRHLVPLLDGVTSVEGKVLGDSALQVTWRLSDHSLWTIHANFGDEPVRAEHPKDPPLHSIGDRFHLWHTELST